MENGSGVKTFLGIFLKYPVARFKKPEKSLSLKQNPGY
jgi:hypothetical protein